MSFSQTSLDLNLSLSGKETESMNVPLLPVEPFFAKDSVMLTPTTAIHFGENMLSSSNQRVLARRSEFAAVNDSMCLSIQAAFSLSNLCHCFWAKRRANESLYAKVASLKKELQESGKMVHLLKKENKNLSKMLSKYQT